MNVVVAAAFAAALGVAGSASTTSATWAGSAAWSPDAKTLAFSQRTTDGRVDVYRVNVDGTGLQDLTADDSTTLLHPAELAPHGEPAWSSGTRLAYAVDRSVPNDRDVEYWTMNADGGRQAARRKRGDRPDAVVVARRDAADDGVVRDDRRRVRRHRPPDDRARRRGQLDLVAARPADRDDGLRAGALREQPRRLYGSMCTS